MRHAPPPPAPSPPALLAAVLLWAGPAAAIPLSLDEALARAAQGSPVVRRAAAERRVAESRRVGAGVRLPANPFVAGSVGLAQVSPQTLQGSTYPGGSGLQWGLHIEQSIEVGGQRGLRLDEVDEGVAAARERERFALTEARAGARQAYLDALVAAERLDNERLRLELAQRLLESVRTRAQAGAAAGVDVGLAETERGRVAASVAGAELDEQVASARLRTLVSLDPDEPLRLTTPLAVPPADPPPLAELMTHASERRADLQALRADARELLARVKRLGREVVPSPMLFADLQIFPEAGSQAAQSFVGGGLGLPIPLGRRNQGERAVALAERARVESEAEVALRRLVEELAVARAAVVQRRAQAALYQEQVVPAAERTYQLTTEGYRSGKFDLFRLISAARELAEARRERTTALGAVAHAHVALDRALGEPR